jgi:hypothetical protein
LQGALLGGALGGAGGAFISGAGGLSSLMPSFGSVAAPTAASLTAAPTVANPAIAGFTGEAVTPAMSTIFSNPTSAIGGLNIGGGPSTGMIPSSLAETGFMDTALGGLKSAGQFAQQNPYLTQMATQTAQQMMQQQPFQMAPAGQVNRGQIQANDYMSLLNPQQGTVLRPQPISLLG